jgi:hypothetical protein
MDRDQFRMRAYPGSMGRSDDCPNRAGALLCTSPYRDSPSAAIQWKCAGTPVNGTQRASRSWCPRRRSLRRCLPFRIEAGGGCPHRAPAPIDGNGSTVTDVCANVRPRRPWSTSPNTRLAHPSSRPQFIPAPSFGVTTTHDTSRWSASWKIFEPQDGRSHESH